MRIGIDLGGTKIEGIALDDNGEQLWRQRVDTPVGDYEATLKAISNMVLLIEAETEQVGSVGIGTPGALSPQSGLLRNSNSVCMNDRPVKQDLEQKLSREIRISNDANCFALSEAIDGAAQGANVVFGVIIGTGTGAGIVVNGQVLEGPNAIAGEWGHNPLPWSTDNERPGPDCYCGKQGCIETYLSGPGLSQAYKSLTSIHMSAIDIVARAKAADPVAVRCVEAYEDRMARSLAHVINILDPDVIVLGGGMSNIRRLYGNVPSLIKQYVFSDVLRTRLLPPKFGDSSGVRGAAWLWGR